MNEEEDDSPWLVSDFAAAVIIVIFCVLGALGVYL